MSLASTSKSNAKVGEERAISARFVLSFVSPGYAVREGFHFGSGTVPCQLLFGFLDENRHLECTDGIRRTNKLLGGYKTPTLITPVSTAFTAWSWAFSETELVVCDFDAGTHGAGSDCKS